MTQSRVTNIPIFSIFNVIFHILDSMCLSVNEVALTSILFQHTSFFAFGGSNAISSIDLSNAYNGINGYNVTAVGALTFCSNWAGPLWWASAMSLLLIRMSRQHRPALKQYMLLSTLFAASSVLFVMLACTALRAHLFIWTVFSPKYLYSLAWGIGQHVCVNIVSNSLLLWLAEK